MNTIKYNRIDAEIQKELAYLLSFDVKDPRIAGAMINVIKVKTTKDLKYAKVLVSIMDDDKKSVLAALQSSQGFLRSSLAERLRIRAVPELHFELDDSFEYSQKIENLIKQIHKDDEEKAKKQNISTEEQ